MENIYTNTKPFRPKSKEPPKTLVGSDNSKKKVYVGVIISLGLLNALLLTGLIFFFLHSHQSQNFAADLSTKLSYMTEERDRLNANLTEITEELRQKNACPAGWVMFNGSCYLLSGCGSWDDGKEDCIKKDAHLVVISSTEEQTFVATYTEKSFWIGLNDKETEGSWKWVDGTSPILTFWVETQPDNGGEPGAKEEDCAHIRTDDVWNDLPCSTLLNWMCEKDSLDNHK